MSYQSYNPDDDATQLVRPSPGYWPQQGQAPREKLVLGNFSDQPQSSQRRPYQYQPSLAQQAGPPAIPPMRGRQRRKGKGCTIGCLTMLVLLIILVIFTFTTGQRVMAFGSAISPQAPLSTQTGYMNTSDRTNLLVMGFGGGVHDGAYLTDSMMVISMMPQSHHTSLVSVPRDLWVSYPDGSASRTKINALYTIASHNGKDTIAGGDAAVNKIQKVTGLDVKYWMTINFAGFRNLIDSIGGVDVYVPDAFNACYPNNDDAAVDASWRVVDFKQGTQHMDGSTAIAYARAREPLAVCGKGDSENLAELTDFGRSARQQIIIKAALSKVKQVSTWPRLFDAMDALKQTIYTNMSLADLAAFSMKMDLNDPKAARIGLSNQNVLADSQSDDGQYILLPQDDNWGLIPDYINKHLYN